MGPALTNQYTLNGCAAYRAGFSLPLVDAKVILIIPAAINPIDTGAIAADALP